MAYQNVGTPRFYINVIEWLDSSGYHSWDKKYYTLPVGDDSIDQYHDIFESPLLDFNSRGFLAILGHNLNADTRIALSNTGVMANIVNGVHFYSGETGVYSGIVESGFSISTYDGTPTGIGIVETTGVDGYYTGSIIIGTYYDMPHSPDLNLTMTRDYGGIKTIETKGGASLSNAFYTKPPKWGGAGAWELYLAPPQNNQKLSRSGRRIWDLSFSYLDDGDVFGVNQYLGQDHWGTHTSPPYDEGDLHDGGDSDNRYKFDLLTDYNFYSQVIHKTNGGQLPFIFQPDINDNTQFAICKFDMNSFQFKQVANSVYNVKLKIREVW